MSRLDSIKREISTLPQGDPAHDASHILRVYKNAELLCKKEKVDPELVLASVLLHDIVSFKKSDPRNRSASGRSAARARQILRKHGYSRGEIAIISDAVRDHSFSKNTRPKTIEGRILQDADRLDAIGAIGIARAFAVGGSENRSLYNSDDPFCKGRKPDDGKWTLDHFYRKLLRLEGLMNTGTGKSIARQRTDTLKGFLEQLGREISS